jgi:acetylornithine deacetylase
MTTIQMTERLVAFDTTSANSNRELVDFVVDYLSGHGVDAHVIESDDGTKANLFASIGPEGPGGVALSGHMDVVPVTGQPWDTDPFEVARADGRLYGRGTCDMKGFLAICLSLVPEMVAARLARPIHLAFSYDEEVGCLGAPRMIAEIGAALPRPDMVIIGEPTEMMVANAHKGAFGFRSAVVGHAAHSSATHRGVNAIIHAARMIEFLSRLADELRRRAPESGAGFEPPHTTISVGTIEGGTAVNIIPRDCRFDWDVRLLPGTDLGEITDRLAAFVEAELLPEMHRVDPASGVETVPIFAVPALLSEPGSPAEALALRLAGSNRAGVVAFGTEGGQFQEAGIPTVICGPGSIAQAHQPNEFIEVSQIEAGEAFVRGMIDWAREDEG